jgi:RNA recognition motif-containing protein
MSGAPYPAAGGLLRRRDPAPYPRVADDASQRTTRSHAARPSHVVLVGNVDYGTDPDAVLSEARRFGDVKRSTDAIAHSGIMFVVFYDVRDAERCVAEMPGHRFGNRPCRVIFATPRDADGFGDTSTFYVQLRTLDDTTIAGAVDVPPQFSAEAVGALLGRVGTVARAAPTRYADEVSVRFHDMRDAELAHRAYDGLEFAGHRLHMVWQHTKSARP